MSCGVGHRCGSDLAMMWLWHRLEATAPIPPLAWEPPYAMGMALKRQNKFIYKIDSAIFLWGLTLFLNFTCLNNALINITEHMFS